jgi:hypothetical protein
MGMYLSSLEGPDPTSRASYTKHHLVRQVLPCCEKGRCIQGVRHEGLWQSGRARRGARGELECQRLRTMAARPLTPVILSQEVAQDGMPRFKKWIPLPFRARFHLPATAITFPARWESEISFRLRGSLISPCEAVHLATHHTSVFGAAALIPWRGRNSDAVSTIVAVYQVVTGQPCRFEQQSSPIGIPTGVLPTALWPSWGLHCREIAVCTHSGEG